MFIYYAFSYTRLHVATTTVDRLPDYVTNTPEDGFSSAALVQALNKIIDANLAYESRSTGAEALVALK